MAERVIYKTVERDAPDPPVPVREVMINGVLDFYPDVLQHNYFSYSLKGSNLVLRAGNCIGLIPLNDRIALLVEPKVSRSNWLYIVGKARGYLRELLYLRDYAQIDYASQSLLEFLARAFVLQLRPLEEHGLYREYQSRDEVTPSPRGKLLFNESIRFAWSRGRLRAVAVRYHTFSKDNAHNRLLKYALSLATSYLRPWLQSEREFVEQIRNVEDLLQQVPFDATLRYLSTVQSSIDRASIPDSRRYYYEVCETAILLVEQLSLLPTPEGDQTTLSFVVNMESVFQDYCYQVLRERAHMLGPNMTVLHEPEGSQALFVDPSHDTRKAEPDIVIANPRGTQFVLEVKYKTDPSREDLNQAITYGIAYRLTQVVLVCFAEDKRQNGWEYKGRVGGQLDVYVYRLKLESPNLPSEEATFATSIAKMLVAGNAQEHVPLRV
jgi:5-methylcytosine-specific restriction enzyme subunit McrC